MAQSLADRLAEAEAAYHALQIGKSAVEIRDQSGEAMRYTPANVSRLKQYIAELKAEIAGSSPVRGPLRPFFA